ncbi:TIGR00282 family metallophosphoesterase [candidate division WOR-3 bacterium]|nr:TIGR00282 family metallophosphoesterase [candidate division WOR-3 bacterium]
MKVLFVGDIYGKPGRRVASSIIPALRDKESIDFVIANGENSAGGFGITLPILRKLERYGVDCITSGNHLWDKKEIIAKIDTLPNLLRPANYPELAGGRGSQIFNVGTVQIGVMNLMGRTLMPQADCPFRTAIREIEKLNTPVHSEGVCDRSLRMIIVDFHAESPAEKRTMGFWLDGKVSAVLGTHTHVQSADEQILPQGTAYITDAGMTGGFDSVIGVKSSKSIKYFTLGTPQRFDSARGNEHLNGVLLDIDETSGKAKSIQRIRI